MLATPIEVKKAYKEGTHKKNYRFVVLNDDGTEDFTIDNDTLVAESVHIDERMATGSELKFGLCEGSSLEFQYFDHPNINGRTVQAFIDIYYDDVNTHSTPMGYFTVKECPRQFSTGIYKVTAYNKLMSEYLDAKANDLLLSNCGNPNLPLSVYDIQTLLLSDYQITQTSKTEIPTSVNYLYSTALAYYGVRLTSSTSDITPINYYNILRPQEKAYNTTFYLSPNAFGWRYALTPSKCYTIATDFDISMWETQFINYIADLINNSQLNKNSSEYFNWIANTTTSGWKNIMAIEVKYSDNTTQLFSDEAYSRGVATGTFKDIVNKIITNAIEVVWWQCVSIEEDSSSSATTGYRWGLQHFDGPDYNYQQASGTGVYSTFKFPNGEDMPYYAQGGQIEPIPYWFHCYELLGLSEAEKVTMIPTQMSDFTLREIIGANYETQCQFGQLDRQTDLFSGVELNGGGLYPAETLYPADGLYPNSNTGGQGIHPYPSEYSQLWTDTMGEQSFRYLIITYKTLDENNQEVDAVLQRTVNADGTTDYNMSDNWLFRNLVWTAADVGDYADAMVLKMHNIRWFPFEMWAAGLPYVETGDAIEITDREGNTHNSYILQRQLQGIQNLQDTYVNGELDIF